MSEKKLSPIELYMVRRDSMIEHNREKMSGLFDPIVIDGINTDYGVNRKGEVYSYKTDAYLNPAIVQGKKKVTICFILNGKRVYRGIWIDRLVAMAYIPNPEHKKYVKHLNGDLMDDTAENLSWTNEKPVSTAGYSRDVVCEIFDTVAKMYNKPLQLIIDATGVHEWIVLRFMEAIRHMQNNNIEISSESLLSGFQTLTVDGIKNPRYEINPFGIIYQKEIDRYRLGTLSHQGYVMVSLVGVFTDDGRRRLHRLVAETFIPNPEDLPEVHHKNGVTYDPCVWNLEWVTHEDNMREASELGQLKRGIERSNAKYTEDQIHKVCLLISKRVPPKEITNQTGVSFEVIKGIRQGRTWQHISQYYNIPYVIFRHGKVVASDDKKSEEINNRIRQKMERSTYRS